jgi:hypothetical protein
MEAESLRKLTLGILVLSSLGLIVVLIGGLLVLAYGPKNDVVGPGVGVPIYPYYVWGFSMLLGGLAILLCGSVSIIVLFISRKLKKPK